MASSTDSVAVPVRATNRQLLLYALPTLTHAIAQTPMVTFVPGLYSQELGLPLALVGSMLFLSRFADIFVDPVIGWASDRARTRWGRRKPFIAAGLPLMVVACWLLFVPPAQAGAVYLLACLFALYAAFSLIDIPYQSWGAELSVDYDRRSRVTGLRQAFDQGSSMLALGVTAALTWYGSGDLRLTMRVLAIIACIGIPLSFALTLATVPEPAPRRRAAALPRAEQLRLIGRNKPFLLLTGAVCVFVIGGAIAASLHMLVITHVFRAPKVFALIILLESAAAIVGIPAWLRLSARIGKHRAAALAAAWTILLALPWPLLGPSTLWLFIALVGVRGLANGGVIVMVLSMAADTVDVDTAAGGEERNGLYFAVLGMATKLAVAIGVLAGTSLPAAAGFEPARGAANGAGALFALAAVYAWLPALLKLGALPLFWRYPLDRARQQALRDAIAGTADEGQPPSLVSRNTASSA